MDAHVLFDKLLDLRDLNANALAEAIDHPTAQSKFDRFRKGKIRQPRRDSIIEAAAQRLGVNVLAFYDGELAEREWQRVTSDAAGDRKLAVVHEWHESLESHARDSDAEYDVAQIRIPLLENSGSMGSGADELHSDVVVSDLVVSRQWLQQRVHASTLSALRLIHAYGDSMAPTMQDGDILLVDTGQRDPGDFGVYVLRANHCLYIKRVRRRMSGELEVSSDNPAIKTIDVLNGKTRIDVIGRVVWVWNGVAL